MTRFLEHNPARAAAYAQEVDQPEVWSKLAKDQLQWVGVQAAMATCTRAKSIEDFATIVRLAQRGSSHEDLLAYLRMVRGQIDGGQVSDGTERPTRSEVDSVYIYTLAKASKLSELEEFLSAPNEGDLVGTGERLLGEGLFEPAALIFKSSESYSRLAVCYINLSSYREAVGAARRASCLSTWTATQAACYKVTRSSPGVRRICRRLSLSVV